MRTCPVFAHAASLAEIAAQGHVLTPGRYVGAGAPAEAEEAFGARMRRLTGELARRWRRGAALDTLIRERLAGVRYGW